MQALSSAARTAILDGTIAYRGRVNLWRGDEELVADVPLAADPGSISVDETASVLRSCTLNFAPDAADALRPLVPMLGGPVEPTGNEAEVWIDLLLPDGTTESIPQGWFGLRTPSARDTGGALVTVTGRDRSQRIIDAVLTAPYDVPSGTNVATAIHDLIDAAVPNLTYVGFETTSTPYSTTATLHFADGDNRWTHAQDMAASAGKELRFDPNGQLQLRDVPDPSSSPTAWSYIDGSTNLAEEVVQTLDADSTYSHAAVVSQPLDGTAPLRSDVYDTDTTSPTYYLGPFGDRVTRLVSSYISTQAQADAAAAALLRRNNGLIEDVSFVSLPVVVLEEEDVVYVERTTLGIASFYVLSRFPIPLGPATMQITARSRRLT